MKPALHEMGESLGRSGHRQSGLQVPGWLQSHCRRAARQQQEVTTGLEVLPPRHGPSEQQPQQRQVLKRWQMLSSSALSQ